MINLARTKLHKIIEVKQPQHLSDALSPLILKEIKLNKQIEFIYQLKNSVIIKTTNLYLIMKIIQITTLK